MSKGYVLALDMGTSSVKCMVADLKGKPHALTRQEISYSSPEALSPMAREFSPDAIWDAICQLIQRSLKMAGLEGKDVAVVSATSQREGMVVLDAEGQEIYAGPNQDVRAFFEGMALDEAHGEAIYSITGHLPSFLFAPAKLKWLRSHCPEEFNKAHKVLPVCGWLTFKLCGQAHGERSAMGEIGLLDLSTGECDRSLLGYIEVDQKVLPALGDAGDVVGKVTPQAATATGLKEGALVVLGGPDTQCGLLGMTVTEEGQLGILAGWSAPLQLVISSPLLDQKKRTWTGCHVVPHRWVLESSATAAGDSLEWLGGVLGAGYNEGLGSDADPSEETAALGQDQAVAFLGPRVMNCNRMGLQLGGVLFPVPVVQTSIGKPHLLRAALENLAFAIKGNYLQLREIAGLEVSEVWLGGGVANIIAFPQLVADTLDMPVQVPATKDVTLLGAAMCGAVGIGAYPSLREAAIGMRGAVSTVCPVRDSVSSLEERYQRWWSLYRALEGLSQEL
ncbi:MAG: FGGY-family carbohydrate kinase [Dehalococcoidia bacterium]